MTERVTRKAFKNGGSVAVRIPKGWIEEDAEIDIVKRDDGILEIRPLDKEARMKMLLEFLRQQPKLSEQDLPMPVREDWSDRFNPDEMFRD
jgi:virulence-associated protein VagC